MAFLIADNQLRVAVTGGRKYSDRLTAYRWMESMRARAEREGKTLVLMHGSGDGLDQLAEDWRGLREVECWRYPPNWFDLTRPGAVIRTLADGRRYDAAEGPRRSRLMLDEGRPHVLGAFPGGSGTAACVYFATVRDVEIVKVTPELVRPRITWRTLLEMLDEHLALDEPDIAYRLDPALNEVDEGWVDFVRRVRLALVEAENAGLAVLGVKGRAVACWKRTEAGTKMLKEGMGRDC